MTKQERNKCCFRISALDDKGYIEVYGPGNMNIAPLLKDLCYAMINEKKSTIFINLENCDIIDSTFMGTLVAVQEWFGRMGITSGKIMLLNVREELKKLLDMVGVSQIIQILPDEIEVPDFKLKNIDIGDVDRKEKLRVVVEAHEKLIHLNELNKEKFCRFLNLIKKEMQEDGLLNDEKDV